MIHIIICGYKCEKYISRCLMSIEIQTFKNYDKFILIDSDPNRKYLVRQTIIGIESCNSNPDDVIVLIDGDDFLCDEMALEIIDSEYRKNPSLLLTYGSYVNLSSNKSGKFCKPYLREENFRTTQWRGSHLKTFKYRLWQKLSPDELKDDKGEYFKCCADRAIMIPLMEIAGYDRIKHIPTILYCYNDLNPLGVWKTMKDLSKSTREYIANKKPLKMIETI